MTASCWHRWALLAAAPALLTLTACSPSEADLEAAVTDKPGVIVVSVTEVQGDDPIPFATIPRTSSSR